MITTLERHGGKPRQDTVHPWEGSKACGAGCNKEQTTPRRSGEGWSVLLCDGYQANVITDVLSSISLPYLSMGWISILRFDQSISTLQKLSF